MSGAPTFDELQDFLREQLPSATLPDLQRAARALSLIFRFGKPAPAPRKPRTGGRKEKSVADSMGLKAPRA